MSVRSDPDTIHFPYVSANANATADAADRPDGKWASFTRYRTVAYLVLSKCRPY